MTKKRLTIAGATLALIALVYFVMPAAVQKAVPGVDTVLGALAGPEIPFDHLTWGGVSTYQTRTALTQQASTTCNIQSPSSTSTLVYASEMFTVGSTSALYIEAGKSAGIDATTTTLGINILAAGAQGTVVASTSPLNGIDANNVFGPNQWFAFKQGGGCTPNGTVSCTGFVPVGSCTAKFIVN